MITASEARKIAEAFEPINHNKEQADAIMAFNNQKEKYLSQIEQNIIKAASSGKNHCTTEIRYKKSIPYRHVYEFSNSVADTLGKGFTLIEETSYGKFGTNVMSLYVAW